MVLTKILHMNAGTGETSYANNSSLQSVGISKTWGLVDDTLRNMFENDGFSDYCLNMVDFGCASGPNALSVLSHVMDTVQGLCKNRDDLLEIRFVLNDLPSNDFNSLFKLVENFNKGKELVCSPRSRCFIYGSPGSFYSRLFPKKSLHFAYSSFSLHWLSQVPQGLGNKNKENICFAITSPPEVLEAYAEQYRRDLLAFLSLRGEEMVPGGRMVLTFLGRSVEDPYFKDESVYFTMLAQTLVDMVAQGFLDKDYLYSFNMPIYMPCQQEVESIINHEGSFKIDKFGSDPVLWDANKDFDELPFDKIRNGKLVANCTRALMEPMLVSHFKQLINCDVLFERYAEKMGDYLSKGRLALHMLSMSLKRIDN